MVPLPAPGGGVPVMIMQFSAASKENRPGPGIWLAFSSDVRSKRLTEITPPFLAPGLILIPNCMLEYSKGMVPVLNK